MPGTAVAPEGGAGGQGGEGGGEERAPLSLSSSSPSPSPSPPSVFGPPLLLLFLAGGRDRSVSWSAAAIPLWAAGERKPFLKERKRGGRKGEGRGRGRGKKEEAPIDLTVNLPGFLRELPLVQLGGAQGRPELGRDGALFFFGKEEEREKGESLHQNRRLAPSLSTRLLSLLFFYLQLLELEHGAAAAAAGGLGHGGVRSVLDAKGKSGATRRGQKKREK